MKKIIRLFIGLLVIVLCVFNNLLTVYGSDDESDLALAKNEQNFLYSVGEMIEIGTTQIRYNISQGDYGHLI